MSMINDALRRASESEKNQARPTPSQTPRMEAAPAVEPARSPYILIAVALIALVLAACFFWKGWNARPVLPPAAPLSAAAPVVPPVVAPKPVSLPVILPATPVPLPVVVSNAPLPVVAPILPAPWPALKLKGIFFSPANPRVLINGMALGVGDEIEDAHVTKIENDQVTLEWKGRTKILRMQDE